MNVAVLGAGAFGTALAVHLKRLGHDITVWTRGENKAKEIPTGSNDDALPGITFEPGLAAMTDLAAAVREADLALLAVPSPAIGPLAAAAQRVKSDIRFVCVAKGMEPATQATHSEVVAASAPGAPFCVLTGPSFAREVLAGEPTALVAASTNREL